MKPHMRICFISSYPPTHARLSEYAQRLLHALAGRDSVEKIVVLADKVEGANPKQTLENGKIEVSRVWSADNPFSILKLFWKILLLKPDIVHFNLHFQSFGKSRISNFSGFTLIGLCRLFNLRTVVLLHNLAERIDFEKLKLKRSFVNSVGIFLAMRLVTLSSITVLPVRCYVDDIKKRYNPKRVSFIPHGTVVSESGFSQHAGDKVVLMFGHMGPSKGVPTMFEAFEQISKEKGGIKLVVAGGSHPNYPSYLSDLKKVAPKGVEFLGYIEETDVEKVFKSADVVVLPYLVATGTSGVFHLACGYGKSIVASALPEIVELVNDGASAVLARAGDVQSFKNGISQALFNEDVAEKMSWQNLRFATREGWGFVAREYERVYLDLMFKSKSS